MASSGVLYSNENDLIQRKVEAQPGLNQVPPAEISDVFDISKCTNYIQENNCKYVGLQFPDNLLINSTSVIYELEKNNASVKFFIMADTSYGNCDVDEVNGQHINVDLIIHYGNASLNPTAKTPTLYVFDKCKTIDCNIFISAFREKFQQSNRIIMLYDLCCAEVVKVISPDLMNEYPYLSIGKVMIPSSPLGKSEQSAAPEEASVIKELCVKACPGCSCRLDGTNTRDNVDEDGETHINECKNVKAGHFKIPIEINKNINNYAILYIGLNDSVFLKQFQLENPSCEIYLYDANTNTLAEYTTNPRRQLMKRYFLIEKAKDAKTVGILVGTLGVAGYLDAITHMKNLIKFSNKKSYTFIVGKINLEKLANFMEIDIFVLIASAENSLQDYRDFYKPVITPFELEVACNPSRNWSSEYVVDFRQLSPSGNNYIPLPESSKEDVTMSLITGAVRGNNVNTSAELNNEIESMALINSVQKDVDVYHPNSAVNFLKERSWAGLKQEIGKTPVETAKTGRSGIASSYTDEPDF